MAATLKLSHPISDFKPNSSHCDLLQYYWSSEHFWRHQPLIVNTVFWGPKILPNTAVKILPFHRATLTSPRKLKLLSYLNIVWSMTLHSCFFWQANTTIFQGSEDCGRHLLGRKQKLLLLNHVQQLPGRHSCMTERCSSGTHLHFGCCQSWIPGEKKKEAKDWSYCKKT